MNRGRHWLPEGRVEFSVAGRAGSWSGRGEASVQGSEKAKLAKLTACVAEG